MTKVMLRADEKGGLFYDCLNHAGDHDACVIMSTLSNVLVAATFRAGHEPTEYSKGHVRIDIPKAEYPTIEVFRSVDEAIRVVAKKPEYKDYIKLY